MSKETQIKALEMVAKYHRIEIEAVQARIKELSIVAPYAELKAAHAAGKRIAYLAHNNGWRIIKPDWTLDADEYKIVEDDEEIYICHIVFGHKGQTKYSRCALTGKITAEVVE